MKGHTTIKGKNCCKYNINIKRQLIDSKQVLIHFEDKYGEFRMLSYFDIAD